MSHFTVLVIGEDIKKQLAPFQENNMGDCPEKFMEFNDVEPEYRERYENDTETRYKRVGDEDLYEGGEDIFYRVAAPEEVVEFNSLPYFERSRKFPRHKYCDGGELYLHIGFDDFELIEVPVKEIYPTFDKYMTEYAGYRLDEKTGKYGYWENPNRKWDWYTVGGRWTGFFKLKEGAKCEVGSAGIMTERAKPGYADSALKGDIDFEAMRDAAGEEAGSRWDAVDAKLSGIPREDFVTWDKARDEMFPGDIEAAQKFYNEQPLAVAFKGCSDTVGYFADISDYLVPREKFVQTARDGAVCTFAILKDGKWYERGEMGWWCYVANEKDKDDWNSQFAKLIDELPDDARLTVVDCHI